MPTEESLYEEINELNEKIEELSATIEAQHKEIDELFEENSMLRGIIKVLCSDVSIYGSASYQKATGQLNREHRALLFEVLAN